MALPSGAGGAEQLEDAEIISIARIIRTSVFKIIPPLFDSCNGSMPYLSLSIAFHAMSRTAEAMSV
jgi:hypothetical protein